ncbi:hypothetical protein KCU98_g21657, partial [Aureobasidium melanogenum]
MSSSPIDAANGSPVAPSALSGDVERIKELVRLSSGSNISHQIFRRSFHANITQEHILKELDSLQKRLRKSRPPTRAPSPDSEDESFSNADFERAQDRHLQELSQLREELEKVKRDR